MLACQIRMTIIAESNYIMDHPTKFLDGLPYGAPFVGISIHRSRRVHGVGVTRRCDRIST